MDLSKLTLTPESIAEADELCNRIAAETEQKVKEINARHQKECEDRQVRHQWTPPAPVWREPQPSPVEQAILDRLAELTAAVNRLTEVLIEQKGTVPHE